MHHKYLENGKLQQIWCSTGKTGKPVTILWQLHDHITTS